jgi:DNA-binding response OmpR family regulator
MQGCPTTARNSSGCGSFESVRRLKPSRLGADDDAMAAARPAISLRPPVVLVVDDDDDIRALVGFRLRRAGYDAVEAHDGLEALRLWRRVEPDLVLLDVAMPGLDGHAVTRILAAGERRVPVVFLSALSTGADRVAGLELGAADYLTKPFDMQELLLRVERALSS